MNNKKYRVFLSITFFFFAWVVIRSGFSKSTPAFFAHLFTAKYFRRKRLKKSETSQIQKKIEIGGSKKLSHSPSSQVNKLGFLKKCFIYYNLKIVFRKYFRIAAATIEKISRIKTKSAKYITIEKFLEGIFRSEIRKYL